MKHSFVVRLNMSIPSHRRVWDALQQRGERSYTSVVVDALLRQADMEIPEALQTALSQMQGMIAQFSAMMRGMPTMAKGSDETLQPTLSLDTQLDEATASANMDAAIDFMSQLT